MRPRSYGISASAVQKAFFFKIFSAEFSFFVSYENELSVNSALTFHLKNNDDTVINNYTKVTAKKYGWLWDIPLQHRKGMGYVFNNNYINENQAQEEIEKDLGFKIEPQSYIKFNAGRMEKMWTKNVLSTGLSSGFVEPLEATSIHMTVLQINHFIEQFFTNDIKDFIVLHYQTPRKDTDFWKEASSRERRSDRLNSLLELWKTRMPRSAEYRGVNGSNFYNLGNTLWIQVLWGMKLIEPDVAKNELKNFHIYDYAEKNNKLREKFDDYVVDNSIDNNNFYNNIDDLKNYKEVWQ